MDNDEYGEKIRRCGMIGVNLFVFPFILLFELAHYAIYGEWMSFAPSELWNQVFDSV